VRECPSRKPSERSSGEIAREPQKSRAASFSCALCLLAISQAAATAQKDGKTPTSLSTAIHAERHPPFCHSQHAFFHLIYYNLVWRGEAESRKGSGAHQRHTDRVATFCFLHSGETVNNLTVAQQSKKLHINMIATFFNYNSLRKCAFGKFVKELSLYSQVSEMAEMQDKKYIYYFLNLQR